MPAKMSSAGDLCSWLHVFLRPFIRRMLAWALTRRSFPEGWAGRAARETAGKISGGRILVKRKVVAARIGPYAVAARWVLLAAVAQFALANWVGRLASFAILFPAVVAGALLGAGPGALGLGLSLAVGWSYWCVAVPRTRRRRVTGSCPKPRTPHLHRRDPGARLRAFLPRFAAEMCPGRLLKNSFPPHFDSVLDSVRFDCVHGFDPRRRTFSAAC